MSDAEDARLDAVDRALLYTFQLSGKDYRKMQTAFSSLAFIRALEQDGFTVAPRPEPLDVERLARAMEDVFPGWLDEAPGTAEAQAEMRSYARQLGEAYEFLRDSASPGLAAPSEPTDG